MGCVLNKVDIFDKNFERLRWDSVALLPPPLLHGIKFFMWSIAQIISNINNLFCYAVWIWLGEGKAVGSKVFLWQHFGVVGDCHHIVYTIWGCNLFKTLITSSFLGFFLFPNFIRASVGSHFIKIMNIVPDYYKYNFQTRLYIGLSPEHYISYMLR